MRSILISLWMIWVVPAVAQVEIVVNAYPEDSPEDLKIYVTGSFNDWQAADENYRLRLNEEGKWHIKLAHLSDSLIEFKFTAGSWDLIESDHNRLPRPNRKININQTPVYEAEIYNWQEISRGEGSALFVFGVIAACLFSAVLLLLYHKFHGKIILADFKIPALLIALALLQGWYFFNYNTYQWHPLLNVIHWVSLAGIAIALIYLYKTKTHPVLLYIFAASTMVFIAGTLSALASPEQADWVTTIEHYVSIFISQYFLALLGTIPLQLRSDPLPVPTEPDKDTLPIAREFERLIHREEIYSDQELTLEKLATQMGLHRNLLSKVINEHYGKRFSDYMIELRIEAFIALAVKPGMIDQYTFFGLAQKVGFNSKSAFNRAFKKITNQTPTQYFQATATPQE